MTEYITDYPLLKSFKCLLWSLNKNKAALYQNLQVAVGIYGRKLDNNGKQFTILCEVMYQSL